MIRGTRIFQWIFFLTGILTNQISIAQQPKIIVDFSKEIGNMKPIYAWFGYDEPNYTYMKDGKKLLSEIAALSPIPVHVRAPAMVRLH
jgi:xylan 1,4-beta-xylosidase